MNRQRLFLSIAAIFSAATVATLGAATSFMRFDELRATDKVFTFSYDTCHAQLGSGHRYYEADVETGGVSTPIRLTSSMITGIANPTEIIRSFANSNYFLCNEENTDYFVKSVITLGINNLTSTSITYGLGVSNGVLSTAVTAKIEFFDASGERVGVKGHESTAVNTKHTLSFDNAGISSRVTKVVYTIASNDGLTVEEPLYIESIRCAWTC